MQKKSFQFNSSRVDYYFDSSLSHLKHLTDREKTIIITDENIFAAHGKKFKGIKVIVLKAGEKYKVQKTVDTVVGQLIEMEAGRDTMLIGVGGGVITDLTGYVASIFLRGVSFGFVPASLLAMVDASIGGKNGIDVGVYKNMVGTIRQPSFILYDSSLLRTLPQKEWRNGFAEIIKHAVIKNLSMFRELEQAGIAHYQKKIKSLASLVMTNAILKTRVVQKDEFEKGDRKLLNFGHTLGHALENQYDLSHGEAVAIGMGYASKLSESVNGFKGRSKILDLLKQYELPTSFNYDRDKVIAVLKKDKKNTVSGMQFILLEKIGKGIIQKIPIEKIYETL